MPVPSGENDKEGQANPALFIRSVAKAFQVLRAFDGSAQTLGLTEIAKLTGLDKSAAQRFVHTLAALGYLERDDSSRRYALGRSVLDLSFSYLRANPLVERATPTLIDLRRNTQERVGLSLWDDLSLIYVVRLQSKRETFFSTLVGRRMPVFCTSGGRAILSRIGDEEAMDVIHRSPRRALTAQTATDPDEIFRRVLKARRDGFALNLEEALPGELTISAAVMGPRGRPVGAVHVSGSLSEWDPADFTRKIAPQVVETAHALGR